jgi:N-acetylglutamate synthase-like GNAT family acetyltransferase
MESFKVRPINNKDKEWVTGLLREWWAGPVIVTRGKMHQCDELPGFIVFEEGKPVGLATYEMNGTECEITSMKSLVEGKGVGTALIDAVKDTSIRTGCQRLWLITTNDNTRALRFYQKRGFSLVAIHRNAVEKSRQLKPEIPLTGNDSIPIRDEIELVMML